MHATTLDKEGNVCHGNLEGYIDEAFPLYTFIHNGDYSGDVTVIVHTSPAHSHEIDIPMDALKEFVGQHYMAVVQGKLEQLTGREFLEIWKGPSNDV